MRLVICVAILVFAAVPGLSQTLTKDNRNQTVTPQMQVLVPRIGGRVQMAPLGSDKPQGAVSYTHQWPGVYWEAGFDGTTVVLKFNDPQNEYRLIIDDLPAIAIAQPGSAEITVADLTAGQHHLRLEKVTESIWILGTFEGFYAAADTKPSPTRPRTRQIEFIGDSDMTGYGLRSSSRICAPDEVRLRSDTQAAYPALVAKHFNADYQINAISGRGMVRNFDGISPDHTMAAIYERILPDQTDIDTPYADPDWHPQIIFLGLGNNDFFSPLHPDEPWKTRDALIDSYIAGMVDLLKTLQAAHPTATVMIYWPDRGIMTEPEKARLDREGQSRLTQTAQKLGLKPLQFVTMGNLELDALACDYHGSASDHRKKASWLIDRINLQPDLWAGQ